MHPSENLTRHLQILLKRARCPTLGAIQINSMYVFMYRDLENYELVLTKLIPARLSVHHGVFSVPSLNCHNPCSLSALMVLIFTPVMHNSITFLNSLERPTWGAQIPIRLPRQTVHLGKGMNAEHPMLGLATSKSPTLGLQVLTSN